MTTESKCQKFLKKILKLGYLKYFENPQNKCQFTISNEKGGNEKIRFEIDLSRGLDEEGREN